MKLWNRINEPEREVFDAETYKRIRRREMIGTWLWWGIVAVCTIFAVVKANDIVHDWQKQQGLHENEAKLQANSDYMTPFDYYLGRLSIYELDDLPGEKKAEYLEMHGEVPAPYRLWSCGIENGFDDSGKAVTFGEHEYHWTVRPEAVYADAKLTEKYLAYGGEVYLISVDQTDAQKVPYVGASGMYARR